MDSAEYLSGKIFLQDTKPVAKGKKIRGNFIEISAPAVKKPEIKPFKSHFKEETNSPAVLVPRYSPDAPNALVLYRTKGPTDDKYRNFVEISLKILQRCSHRRCGCRSLFMF